MLIKIEKERVGKNLIQNVVFLFLSNTQLCMNIHIILVQHHICHIKVVVGDNLGETVLKFLQDEKYIFMVSLPYYQYETL